VSAVAAVQSVGVGSGFDEVGWCERWRGRGRGRGRGRERGRERGRGSVGMGMGVGEMYRLGRSDPRKPLVALPNTKFEPKPQWHHHVLHDSPNATSATTVPA
jgi:hypothetical protein